MEGLGGAEFAWPGRAVGGNDNKWEEEIGGERGNCEDKEGASANSGGRFPGLVNFPGCEVGVRGEDGVDVELANVSGYVEKKRKPAYPVEELDLTDFANLGWKPLQGGKDLAKEGDDTNFLRRWRTFEARISFANIKAGDQDCATKSKCSDDAQNLELRIPENASSEFR